MTTLPDYSEALQRILGRLPDALPTRTRAAGIARGATLAKAIIADRDQPAFDRAEMDGYAVRATDVRAGARLRIIGETPAGAGPGPSVGQGQTVRIATGAPLPPGADAVVPHEETDRGEPIVMIQRDAARPGQSVHPRAADAAAGDVVLPAATCLAPHHLAIASAVGATTLQINGGPPSISVLTSGDELVDPTTPTADLRPEQIRDAALPMLAGFAAGVGSSLVGAHRLPDDAVQTHETVARAAESSDVVVTLGGVSAGERDFFPSAIAATGAETIIRGAAIKPGRPILVALRPEPFCVFVGLPGNPVSALATAHLFLWPVVRRLSGAPASLPWRDATLAEPVSPNARRQTFRPVILDEHSRVRAPAWRGSGDLMHTASTHGLIDLARGVAEIGAGTTVRFLPWAWEGSR